LSRPALPWDSQGSEATPGGRKAHNRWMEESDDFSRVLLGDMADAIKGLKEQHPRQRRTCVRAAFAAVEGHLAALSQELLAKAASGLSETERMALRNEGYRVSDSGKIVTIAAYQPLKHRVKLVTAIVQRLHPEYAIDFRSAGWQALLKGLDVRDRITHPKNRLDMGVEQSELEATINGVFWFLMAVIAPGRDGIAAYLERNRPPFTLADLDRYGYGAVWPSVMSAPPNEADSTVAKPLDPESSD
jgi:hypothetical protein